MEKWLVRFGSLIILLGCLLPITSGSCDDLLCIQNNLINQVFGGKTPTTNPLLLMIPISTIVVFFITFLNSEHRTQAFENLIGQIIAVTLGLICLIVATVSLPPQTVEANISLASPGVITIISGYFITFCGLLTGWVSIYNLSLAETQFFSGKDNRSHSQQQEPVKTPKVISQSIPQKSYAKLEMTKGILLPSSTITIRSSNFFIGRMDANDLQLLDKAVSRKHSRICFSGEDWFIQDQESMSGTYVNHKRVSAVRLQNGDIITIGRNSFIFRNT